MSKIVYCKNCKYVKELNVGYRCIHPKFLYGRRTPYGRERIYMNNNLQKYPNKNNDCKYFEFSRIRQVKNKFDNWFESLLRKVF